MDQNGNIVRLSQEEAAKLIKQMEKQQKKAQRLTPVSEEVAAFMESLGPVAKGLWARRIRKGMKPALKARFDKMVTDYNESLKAEQAAPVDETKAPETINEN